MDVFYEVWIVGLAIRVQIQKEKSCCCGHLGKSDNNDGASCTNEAKTREV